MPHLVETQFNMTRGDAKSYRVTVLNDAGGAVNLSGAAIKAQFRKHPHSPVMIDKELGSGIDIEDAAAGTFLLHIVPADTVALGNWRQVYGFDVQVTKDDQPVTVARGTLTIEPTYTE